MLMTIWSCFWHNYLIFNYLHPPTIWEKWLILLLLWPNWHDVTLTLGRTLGPCFSLVFDACKIFVKQENCWLAMDRKSERGLSFVFHLASAWNNSFLGCQNKQEHIILVKGVSSSALLWFFEQWWMLTCAPLFPCCYYIISQRLSF